MICNYLSVTHAKNPPKIFYSHSQKSSKNPAKTPQKTHKNLTKIWWDKNFYIFLNINTNKKPKT